MCGHRDGLVRNELISQRHPRDGVTKILALSEDGQEESDLISIVRLNSCKLIILSFKNIIPFSP